MSQNREKAVLAGGCFWGMQDLIRGRPGVLSTRVGYTGGDVANATYRNHGTHAEAIEVTFDPEVGSHRELLEFFFQVHDPTTLNRQGNDVGTSYRSAIFYLDDEQRRVAEDTIADVDASGLWPGKVVTEVTPAGPFWEAEPEHQDYLERPVRSGRPSRSTRTTWSVTRSGTPATSRARAGCCPTAAPRLASRRRGSVRAAPADGCYRPGCRVADLVLDGVAGPFLTAPVVDGPARQQCRRPGHGPWRRAGPGRRCPSPCSP